MIYPGERRQQKFVLDYCCGVLHDLFAIGAHVKVGLCHMRPRTSSVAPHRYCPQPQSVLSTAKLGS